MRKLLPLLLILLLLVGCAAPPSAPASPVANVAGPPAPSITPIPSITLPAPLYVLDSGQIARIERDGKSRALVTHETLEVEGFLPIATFAVSAQGNLAFVSGDKQADRLVLTGPRGEDRRILYEQPRHELSDLVWSSDGTQIYLRLLNNREPPDTPSGLYRISVASGQLELLRADDPVDNLASPSPTISGYRPFSISPDGTHLLIEIFSIYYDGCGLGLMPTGGGEILRLELPAGSRTYCGEASWAPDGSAVYFLAGGDAGPTTWRGDIASGTTTALADASVLTRAPHLMPDGALRFILVTREDGSTGKLSFALANLAQAQAAPSTIGPPFSESLGQVLWAADGSGAIAIMIPQANQVDLRWIPVGGQPVSLPNTTKGIVHIAWGPPE